jgi:hypothetical protein
LPGRDPASSNIDITSRGKGHQVVSTVRSFYDTLYADAIRAPHSLKQLPRPARHRNPPRGWRREGLGEGKGLEKERGWRRKGTGEGKAVNSGSCLYNLNSVQGDVITIYATKNGPFEVPPHFPGPRTPFNYMVAG